jgi:hypothetical protein
MLRKRLSSLPPKLRLHQLLAIRGLVAPIQPSGPEKVAAVSVRLAVVPEEVAVAGQRKAAAQQGRA